MWVELHENCKVLLMYSGRRLNKNAEHIEILFCSCFSNSWIGLKWKIFELSNLILQCVIDKYTIFKKKYFINTSQDRCMTLWMLILIKHAPLKILLFNYIYILNEDFKIHSVNIIVICNVTKFFCILKSYLPLIFRLKYPYTDCCRIRQTNSERC